MDPWYNHGVTKHLDGLYTVHKRRPETRKTDGVKEKDPQNSHTTFLAAHYLFSSKQLFFLFFAIANRGESAITIMIPPLPQPGSIMTPR